MKKILIIAIAIIAVVGIAFYFKSQSSYEFVKSQEEIPPNEGNSKNEEALTEKPQRSAEDIAMDKRIKDLRQKNEENWQKHGAVSSLESGKGLAPKGRTEKDFAEIQSTIKEYVNSNTEIYPEFNESEISISVSQDPRFEELIWGKPKEERKGLLKDHKDEDMVMMEAKRLDGEYDDVFLVREPDTRKWSIEYIGNYYDFKERLEDNE